MLGIRKFPRVYEEVADDADALALVTEWQQYLELDWEALAGAYAIAHCAGWAPCIGSGEVDQVRIPLSRNPRLELNISPNGGRPTPKISRIRFNASSRNLCWDV